MKLLIFIAICGLMNVAVQVEARRSSFHERNY